MKTIFTSLEIAHIWANQNHAHGRSPGNASFQGRVFISWSTDIGVILEPGRVVLLNVTSYSPSTTAAQSRMLGAVQHFPVKFRVNGLGRGEALREMARDPARLYRYYLAKSAEHSAAAKKPRIRQTTRDGLNASAVAALVQANAVNDFFKLRKKPLVPADVLTVVTKIARASAAVLRRQNQEFARREEAERARQLEFVRQSREAMGEWRDGTLNEIPHYLLRYSSQVLAKASDGFQGNAALRLSADQTRVETSQGAQALVRTVSFLWAFCSQARTMQTAVLPEVTERFPLLDHYRLNGIDSNGNVSVGCHEIAFYEIESIARALNLPPFNGEALGAPVVPCVETSATT